MAETSNIEWTDATWNPITGCTMVSAGCTNCYAMGLAATRMKNHPSRAGLTRMTGGRAVWTGEVRFNEGWLDQPLHWTRPRQIFVCAHGDLFHESVPDEWIDRIFAVMALTPRHTYQVLTKRPERARAYLGAPIGGTTRRNWVTSAIGQQTGKSRVASFDWPLPNVWLGTSVEDQATADTRIPHLLATPTAVRFLSAEPLLGPLELSAVKHREGYAIDALSGVLTDLGVPFQDAPGKLDWIICGGESGKDARPMHPDWARSLRDQCVAAGVPFFFKQWGEYLPAGQRHGITLGDDAEGNPIDIGSALRRGQAVAMDGLWTYRVGKARAGRLLDGREWNQMPGAL